MKKKRTKKSQVRLNNLLIILVLTAVLMVMSTYAWFTANRTVSLQALTVKATTTNGLQISSGTSAWSNSMQCSDLQDAKDAASSLGVTNMLAYNFNNVSTILEPYDLDSTTGDQGLKFYLGKAYQSDSLRIDDTDPTSDFAYVLETVDSEPSGNDYVVESNFDYDNASSYDASAPMMAFDFFLKYTGSASKLFTKVDVTPNTAGSKDIEKAVRVAFVIGDATTSTDYDTEFNPAKTSPGSGFKSLVNGGSAILAFEPWANSIGEKTKTNSAALGLTVPSYPTTTYGIASSIAESDAQKLVDLFGGTTSYTDEVEYIQSELSGTTDTGEVTAQVGAGTNACLDASWDGSETFISEGVTKVRCYIWVEGEDYDCQNGATGGLFDVRFEFALDNF